MLHQQGLNLVIRRYQPDDQPTVWALHNAALLAAGTHAGNGSWDDDLKAIEQVYLEADGEFLVGTLYGRIVAMGALRRMFADRAEVKRMRVDPAWQRCGFGEQVLIALERRAMELGYRTLQLDTMPRQFAAQGLYLKHGWVEVGREAWRGLELIIYEKSLRTDTNI